MTKSPLRVERAVLALLFLTAIGISDTVAQSSPDPTEAVTYLGILQGSKFGAVPYARCGDEVLTCDIYVPPGEGPFPTILAVHGGGWRSGSKIHLVRHAIRFCNNGFAVVSINYRHAPEHPFPAQIEDCFAAAAFLRDHAGSYRLDPNRMLGYGYSAGGHLISLMATTTPGDWNLSAEKLGDTASFPPLRAVVAGGAPCDFDWIADDSPFLHFWLGSTKAENPRVFRKASPRHHVSEKAPPFLLYHGIDDRMVPVGCAQRMDETLRAHGVSCELELIAGAGHLEVFNDLEYVDRASEFYRSVLEALEHGDKANQAGGR